MVELINHTSKNPLQRVFPNPVTCMYKNNNCSVTIISSFCIGSQSKLIAEILIPTIIFLVVVIIGSIILCCYYRKRRNKDKETQPLIHNDNRESPRKDSEDDGDKK